jgi:hypothetical protein
LGIIVSRLDSGSHGQWFRDREFFIAEKAHGWKSHGMIFMPWVRSAVTLKKPTAQ